MLGRLQCTGVTVERPSSPCHPGRAPGFRSSPQADGRPGPSPPCRARASPAAERTRHRRQGHRAPIRTRRSGDGLSPSGRHPPAPGRVQPAECPVHGSAQPTLLRENSSLCCRSGQLLITSGSSISSQSTRSPEQGPSRTAPGLQGSRGLRGAGQGCPPGWPPAHPLTCCRRRPGAPRPGAPPPAAAGSSPRRRAWRPGRQRRQRRERTAAPPGGATAPRSGPEGLREGQKPRPSAREESQAALRPLDSGTAPPRGQQRPVGPHPG